MKLLSTQNVAIIINKYWISKTVPKNVKYLHNVYMLVTFRDDYYGNTLYWTKENILKIKSYLF